MKKRYLDPKNDLPFKRIFGEHPDLLISFLNALMPFDENHYIISIEYLSPKQVPENPAKIDSIVDVRCKDNYGRQFIVEMQMYWNTSFIDRFLSNGAKSYVKRLNRKKGYDILKPVYALGIINDVFDKKANRYYHRYVTENPDNHEDFINGMEFVMIELPKFKAESLMEKKMAVLWLRFLKEIEDEKYIEPAKELMENKYIRQAITLCEEGAFTEKELDAYERYWDIICRENAMRSTNIRIGEEIGFEIGLKKGEKIGLEKGLEKGKKIGRKEGMEIGRKEEQETFVIKSFNNGLSFEIISSITALTEKEIIAILKKNKLI